MILHFHLPYRAQWGEQICVIGHTWSEANPLVLQCADLENWHRSIAIPDFVNEISYRYALRHSDGSYTYEHGKDRYLYLNGAFKDFHLHDFWRVHQHEEPFDTRAFSQCLFRREAKLAEMPAGENLSFQLWMPRIEKGQNLGILGNIPALGAWQAEHMLVLDDTHYPLWKADLRLTETCDIVYKYVIFDKASRRIVDLEEGENRHLHFDAQSGRNICTEFPFRYSQAAWKGAGLAIPVFSLRSEKSFGIGEFMDLKLMADWAAAAGMQMIQTLPINDTTLYHSKRDSYPYNAVSVFALNPIFLNIETMGRLSAKMQAAYEQEKAELNALPIADYAKVAKAKAKYFRSLFRKDKKQVLSSAEYLSFLQKNRDWLVPYALFCYLRDRFGTADFRTWDILSEYKAEEAAKLMDPAFEDADKIAYHLYLQFHLDKQLTEVHQYMHSLGIAFKGDIPIGISPDSVDAWTHPELFNTQVAAGAPPDAFSLSGQNWGFPTYRWDVMARDGFRWWKRRFSKMSDYFDAYRIDHILGFFRIWEIDKQDVWGLKGRFTPALPYHLDELRALGIDLDEKALTEPYITQAVLKDLFGNLSQEIESQFFEKQEDEQLHFKQEFNTQRKLKAYFKQKKIFTKCSEEEKQTWLEKLYLLHSDVLFVKDSQNPDCLHPRIALYESFHYKALDDSLKDKLWQLHENFFYHRHNEFWKESAMSKLPSLIEATDMLVCGEDLGMVPACVPEVMDALNILSLEIERMPKAPFRQFGDTAALPYLSICTTGTHDMNPIRAWWQEDAQVSQTYYNEILHRQGTAPEDCDENIACDIVLRHMQSPAMWCILPLQDYFACNQSLHRPKPQSERINTPIDTHNYWCYRMHVSLEELLHNQEFIKKIASLTQARIQH